jgi:hypothetical protein
MDGLQTQEVFILADQDETISFGVIPDVFVVNL